uniref:P-selectin glycoprotein ligand 1 n=1 Tax=Catagonus wagneri TaxID=51154 RepID=A0A8C3YRN4_9CETA
MLLQLLLLLTLLGPGSSLWQLDTSEDGAKEAIGPLLARGRRQIHEDYFFNYEYETPGTDPTETLGNHTETMSSRSQLLNKWGTLGPRDTAGPSTPEPATLEMATRDSAVLEAGRATTENLSTELATQGTPTTLGPLTKEPVTVILKDYGVTESATVEALSTGPASTATASTEPMPTESTSTEPVSTEVMSTEPASTEAMSTEPAVTEALTTEPTSAEVLSTEPIVIEALSTEPAATAAPSMEPSTAGALHTYPVAAKIPPTRPATMRSLTTALPVPSDPPRGSTAAPSPGEVLPDHNPVKQCLLAILILALVATFFLVCTVVLAIRLSRKNHLYPVRNYSPTEMVCISSLLPDGGEGPAAAAAAANGGPSKAKSQGLKAEPREGHEGDDLTLRSFLP